MRAPTAVEQEETKKIEKDRTRKPHSINRLPELTTPKSKIKPHWDGRIVLPSTLKTLNSSTARNSDGKALFTRAKNRKTQRAAQKSIDIRTKSNLMSPQHNITSDQISVLPDQILNRSDANIFNNKGFLAKAGKVKAGPVSSMPRIQK